MGQGQNSSWDDDDANAFSRLMLCETRQHGVIFFDKDLRIRGWNAGASFITGWNDHEVLGQSTALTFVAEDREILLPEHEAATATAVGVAEDERWHLRKDGSRFWSAGVSIPIRNQAGAHTGFVKIFQDATHLRARTKYLENELQQSANRHLQRDTFVGTIAHEMRNPLGPLHMAIELMKSIPDESGRYQDLVRLMSRQIVFLERLVEDLVDLTRVQTGHLRIAYKRTQYQQLLVDAMDSCRAAAVTKGVNLHVGLPPVPIEVDVDPQRLHQVVVNLVNNAIKFTPEGGSVWLTATVDQTHLVLYVKDNGLGIAADLLPRIFDMFTQAQGLNSERGAGLGIGLAIVKEIVALHQGTVEVRSEGLGKGAEFIVRIPRTQPRGPQAELSAVLRHRGRHGDDPQEPAPGGI